MHLFSFVLSEYETLYERKSLALIEGTLILMIEADLHARDLNCNDYSTRWE